MFNYFKDLGSKNMCCFVKIHLYSNSLSAIAMVSSLTVLENFPIGFSCYINFNLSQSSLGSEDRNLVL